MTIENQAARATQNAYDRGGIPNDRTFILMPAYLRALGALRTMRSINRIQRRRAALEGVELGGES